MNWQPIETAPKDKTRILCVMDGRVEIAQWDADGYAKNPRPFWTTWDAFSKSRDRGRQPQWWMPLPDVPNTGVELRGTKESGYSHSGLAIVEDDDDADDGSDETGEDRVVALLG